MKHNTVLLNLITKQTGIYYLDTQGNHWSTFATNHYLPCTICGLLIKQGYTQALTDYTICLHHVTITNQPQSPSLKLHQNT